MTNADRNAAVGEILQRRPRRIVTAQRPDGTSYFARIEEVDRDYRSDGDRTGSVFGTYRLWANDSLPVQLPFSGAGAPLASSPTSEETAEALRTSTAQPDPHGLRASVVKIPPRTPSEAMLHWHDTFDVQLLVAGELTIVLDDGSKCELRPGDAVIQHGTHHGWYTGPDGAVLALFMLGAERHGVSPPPETKRDFRPSVLLGGNEEITPRARVTSNRSAIENALYLYAWAYDMEELGRLGECFAEDAVVDFPTGARVGRAAVVEELTMRRSKYGPRNERPWHVISNVLIEELDAGAHVRSFVNLHVTSAGDAVAIPRTFGYYDDEFVLEGGRWVIGRRRVVHASVV